MLNLIFIYIIELPSLKEEESQNNGWCFNLNNSLAKSTFERLKTEKCKKKVYDYICVEKMPSNIHNSCPFFDEKLKGSYIGCYKDSRNKRILSSYDIVIPKMNSPKKCIDTCIQGGYIYAGVEFTKECFCGEKIDFNSSSVVKIDDSNCQKYKCPPPNDNYFCGGYEAIAIYLTGMKEYKRPYPVYIERTSENKNNKIKILFLLQLNGRNDRQVKRMLKSVYSPDHYYIVHVDKRQKYMYEKMKLLEKILPNFKVSNDRWSTIWGGASLLTMYLKLVESQLDKEWEFVINMSESDFLVIPLEELEIQLSLNKGINFISSHGSSAERMWRIEERDTFPENMYIDGGSDWIVIHRNFITYALSDEELPRDLRNIFKTVLLPLESFFHTLGYNSRFCDKIKARNLRLTYWKRKQGCRCAKLKKTVDWCGCSPLVFRDTDTSYIQDSIVKQKATYFARKFDDFVDIKAIHFAEKQALKNRENINDIILQNHPSYNSSWVNLYNINCDGSNELINNWAKTLIEYRSECQFINITDIHTFKDNSILKSKIVVTINAKCFNIISQIELLIEYIQHKSLPKNFIIDNFLLLDVNFGLNLDLKEEIFRDPTNLLSKTGTAYILFSWKDKLQNSSSSERKTSPPLHLEWYDGDETLIAIQNISSYDSIFYNQYSLLELDTLPNIKPGSWKLLIKDSINGKLTDECFGDECKTFSWSTHFPDPKSDIINGYDKKHNWIL
ncbi:Xylosyltransferase oxt [Strongyloides ratti]|uniref:protein xylosyltransferase n=1 Tax=Strongyloides ratti TaxID=34506 RepID=A0A090L464_STRRB|nr:Xylosyltransferase oxt [Strongyloides ratti]CEF62907.1 Xylosyltransferase oxt [Strongyloides ratti]